MRQSQQQAALAVRRVLDGQSLGAALEGVGANDAGPARSLVHELAYGTLRHYGALRALARALAAKPITDPALEALVAVALYQLQHTRAPAFAVVDQAVEAAAAIASVAAKGLVNAMLRRFLRERDLLLERVLGEPVARWSHPRWWISRVRADWPRHWESILAAGNLHPPLSLRVNTRRTGRASLLGRFTAAGIEARAEGMSGLVLAVPRPVAELPGFAEGESSVQDLGAQLAAPLMGLRDGMRVLDACAAPGGKTSHILELADVDLTAVDNDGARLDRVRANLSRLGLGDRSVRIVEGDAAYPSTWWDRRPYDRILLDVPCTASGVVRRHPDGKWLRRPTDVARFAEQQRSLIAAAWPMLAPGGALLYATCSVFREENEARVVEFAAGCPDALREPLTFPNDIAHSGGQLLPSPEAEGHNQDGYFYALLRKA